MRSDRVLALLKFGKQNHIAEFLHEGHLYMNTLNYFRDREAADILRADIHEGAEHCLQADGAKFYKRQGDEWVDIGVIRGQIVSTAASKDTTNVFCMYALRESAADSLVDQRNFKFGDTYAVLIDADEFLRRVSVNAEKNLKLKHGLVEYVDKHTYNGKLSAFRKFDDFLYQSEFRIVVESALKAPFSLRIGTLSDIAMTGPLAKINESIRISNVGGTTRLLMRRHD